MKHRHIFEEWITHKEFSRNQDYVGCCPVAVDEDGVEDGENRELIILGLWL
jgi:hypothetical protein